jgi:putative DNA primase/helicase
MTNSRTEIEDIIELIEPESRPDNSAYSTRQEKSRANSEKQNLQGKSLSLKDPEPWPDPVDGADLLNQTVNAINLYMVMEEGCPEAIALWVLHAHAYNAFAHSPRLAITSPEKQCGKTTLLDILTSIVPRPMPTANTTPAAIFRSIEHFHPTLLIDEADTFLHKSDDLRGILNSGHRKATGYVTRTVGDNHEPRIFLTFTPTAIAMIGELPETLADRSISIRLRRRMPHEKILSFRSGRSPELDDLCRKATRWTVDHYDTLSKADPVMPGGLYNRNADNWAPLLAIADEIGGIWPQKAREIALALVKHKDDDPSPSIMLLSDIRTIFNACGVDRIHSGKLLQELKKLDGKPWQEDENGRELSPNKLSLLLKPFGLATKNIRTKNQESESIVMKGFLREAFEPIWERYLPPAASDPANETENIQ